MLDAADRRALYTELETIPGLCVPHVHLRSDCDTSEIDYLARRFGTEAFNIHPRASSHPFSSVPVAWASRIFVENVDIPPEDAELALVGGICPDFSHLENARLQGRMSYVERVTDQLGRFDIGCCHVSAVRVGVPNQWSGEWDHHEYVGLDDFVYMQRWLNRLPARWASLELENSLDEQLAVRRYLESISGTATLP